MSKDRFIKVYAKLPENVRNEVIVVVKVGDIDKPYTWDSAYIEIHNDTPLGKDILKKLEKMELI
ncbi:hypothetical protein HY489_05670 [Candidatus Woesearchaeota archaeon]|nr:hypothetical protein [Candidatus Woesearchaeota archaeon]